MAQGIIWFVLSILAILDFGWALRVLHGVRRAVPFFIGYTLSGIVCYLLGGLWLFAGYWLLFPAILSIFRVGMIRQNGCCHHGIQCCVNDCVFTFHCRDERVNRRLNRINQKALRRYFCSQYCKKHLRGDISPLILLGLTEGEVQPYAESKMKKLRRIDGIYAMQDKTVRLYVSPKIYPCALIVGNDDFSANGYLAWVACYFGLSRGEKGLQFLAQEKTYQNFSLKLHTMDLDYFIEFEKGEKELLINGIKTTFLSQIELKKGEANHLRIHF